MTLKAKERGLIDYSEWDHRDPMSVMQQAAVFNYLENELLVESGKLRYSRLLGVLSASKNSDVITSLDSLYRHLGSFIIPYVEWGDTNTKNIARSEITRLTKAWENKFGKLDDPDTQRRIAEFSKSIQDEELKSLKGLNAIKRL